MEERDEASQERYPLGRGYGSDYMRGGEVLGGYGYSAREEYARPRGELRERRSDVGSTEAEERPETD